MKTNHRNLNVDLLKVLLSFFVIAAHVMPGKDLEGVTSYIVYGFLSISRLCVPLFLILSGYLIRNKFSNKEYLYQYGKRIFILFIVWQLIYYPLLLKFYFNGVLDLKRVLLDSVYGIAHLWYLIATVQGLFLLYLTRNWTVKYKFIVAFALLFFAYLLQAYFDSKWFVIKDWQLQLYATIGTNRNFLFYAFPYLMLGTLYDYWKNIAAKCIKFLIPLFLVMLAENYFYFIGHNICANMYLTCIPIVFLLLYFVLETKKQVKIQLPGNLSLGIYLIHFYAIYFIFQKLNDGSLISIFTKFFLVCIIAAILWYPLEKLNKKFPYFF
jgi:surface polysaccharide O-acyltransferase-like enzyme